MAMWNPWRGCHRYSEGCKYCYIHKGDGRRGVDTDDVVRTDGFCAPVAKNRSGEYKIKPGQTVYLCFSTDFLLEDADEWRPECWRMMRQRPDLHFLFLTKRIERFMDCIPEDWGGGYDNVTVGCTVENQDRADFRLSVFNGLPIKHKNIICQPLIGRVDLSAYLDNVETVVLLSKGEIDSQKVRVEFSLEDMDMSEFKKGATYGEIKTYVLENFGLKVSSLYISQVKRKCGLEVGDNYNLPKSENAKVPTCPPEKEKAIIAALEHFQMILV